jgi:UDPglucose 6-dehydrogenase
MLADLDYLESRTTEKNTNSMLSFENPYEACKEAHAIAVLTEWDEFVQYDWQRIYDSMQKPAFCFDGRNILNGPALEKIGFVYQSIGS